MTLVKSLRTRQSDSLKEMINLNSQSTGSEESGWKVLIYDKIGESILSPVLDVKSLKNLGVTLSMNLHSSRDRIPDVPAIYFISPNNEENFKRITEDFESGLYDEYYFNFISPVPRSRLEDLASKAILTNVVPSIKKLYDQYSEFICLEHDFFVLKHGQKESEALSYFSLHTPQVTDNEMEIMIQTIVDGLFSVCVTLGTVPIIRCPKGNAAEAVAEKLDKKLRENLRDTRNSLFMTDGIQAGAYSFYRPVLILLDRDVDLATPLHHTWTYQALSHDVLTYSLNRIHLVEEDAKSQKTVSRVCDLNDQDNFWSQHKGCLFPLVAENIQEELENYRGKEEDIKRMKHEMSLPDSEQNAVFNLLSDNTQRLNSAVSSLPELLEKKRLIDMHTSIATCILNQIKSRKLDVFFELEEKIMSKQNLGGEKNVLEFIQDPEAGTPEDKMRLFLIYFLCSATELSSKEIEEISISLEKAGCDLSPLTYLTRWKSFHRVTSGNSLDYSGGGTKTVSMFSKLMTTSSNFVMEGVKNLVVKKHALPVTKIVEEIVEIRPGSFQDNYCYFDPKIHSSGKDQVPRAKNPFQEAIVFMVGGGNYIEYQNLMDYAQPKANSSAVNLAAMASGTSLPSKRIIYGCTTLLNANQTMQQLAKLGHEFNVN